MKYWLLKTEPSDYSFDDLVRDKKTVWDGVANNAALICIRNVNKGDLAFVYHTGDEKQIVGIGEIISGPYADPKEDNPKLAVFDIKPLRKLNKPVTLAQVKSDKKYRDFALVKEARKSVLEVPEEYWKEFMKMSE
ncbi:MAG: EVE domain-containing protein [Ignavibacteria bacterium]|nr:EVE domain-containing protein [Ignavibacteria bacterium]